MINIKLFNLVAFVYLFSSVLYLCCFFFKKELIGKAATAVTGAGLAVQTAAYIFRWVESRQLGFDHTPFSFFTLYETLIFASWSMIIACLIVEYKYRIRGIGAVVLPLTSLLILYATLAPTVSAEIEELPSVLRGNLFVYHVVSFTMSYAALGISVVVSIFVLLIRNQDKPASRVSRYLKTLPPVKTLDDISYKSIAIGFILFTIGMATGVYRTKILWGSYWNWDSVETSGLISWILYALILHGRYQQWWGLKASAMFSISAFTISVACFLIAAGYMMSSGHYPVQ